MSELNHEPYWIPNYATGAYGGLDTHHRRRRKKNPIGFAPPKENTMTPYRERREAGHYDAKPDTQAEPKKTTAPTKKKASSK